ncbi:DUF2809 domain-containing protein [uncultured Thiothrix sp.]|uniref:ribosomal maturation YjgA family protein n=1 Tax=uncultured Thiothrix sp. TaxID=223185 RepID=UPI00261B273F|nr:DUF2809 domain-containing protein [uncultured Thiothrix sp.]
MFIAASLLFLGEVLIATKLKDYHFIRAYFGDFLVVILVYCSVLAFWKLEPKRLALGVFIFACLIEIAQFFQLADRLELTGAARIMLGTSFSWEDILMYALGCLSVYVLVKYLKYPSNTSL